MPLSVPAARHVRIMIQVFGLLDPAGFSSPSATRIDRPTQHMAGRVALDRLANALQIRVLPGRPSEDPTLRAFAWRLDQAARLRAEFDMIVRILSDPRVAHLLAP